MLAVLVDWYTTLYLLEDSCFQPVGDSVSGVPLDYFDEWKILVEMDKNCIEDKL